MENSESPTKKGGSSIFGQITGLSKIRGALLGDLTKSTGSVIQGGLTDPENCVNLSKRLFDYYDADKKGQMSNEEVGTMITDVYKHIGRNYAIGEDEQIEIVK